VNYFEFIEAQCANRDYLATGGTKALMFRNLPVSSAGFYAWRKRATGQALSAASQRRADLLVKIASIHKESLGTYGSPRVTADLRDDGLMVTEKTVAAIMAAHGIAGISPRSFQGVHDDPGSVRDDAPGPGESAVRPGPARRRLGLGHHVPDVRRG